MSREEFGASGRRRLDKLKAISFLSFLTVAGLLGAQILAPDRAVRDVTIQQLLGSCVPHPSGGCDLYLSTPIQTVLSGRVRLPEGVRVHFSGEALWTLHGGTLDLAGASVLAPDDRRIFAGEEVVGLRTARPEWFVDAVDGVYPEAALGHAFRAVQPGGVILLRERSYRSPFIDPANANPCGGRTIQFGASLSLTGTRRPIPDVEGNPARLVGGTVLRGGICGNGTLRLSHLGVDAGPRVTAEDFNGHETYGIQLGSGGKLGAVAGTTLDDVSVLTTRMKDQHSVIVEGQREATVRGLWIWTRGGTHGLVMKSSRSSVTDFHCKGASSDCLIFKSDYATSHAGEASGGRADGVFIDFLKHPGDTGGIVLEGRWDTLRNIELSDIRETGLSYGIVGLGSAFYDADDIRVHDWTANRMTGPCLILNGTRRMVIEGFRCEREGPPGLAFYLDGKETTLRHGTILCTTEAALCADPRNDGILDRGAGDRVEGVTGIGLGGYLVRASVKAGGTAVRSLDATGMGGRATLRDVPPSLSLREHGVRLVDWTKPVLRILWTHAETLWRELSGAAHLGLLALVGGLAVSVWLLLRRRGPQPSTLPASRAK